MSLFRLWHAFVLHLMLLASMIMPACSSAPSSFVIGKNSFICRSFSSPKDDEGLSEICEEVMNGRDYVPKYAHVYEQDPTCEFLIVEDEKTGNMVAAGNRRNVDDKGEIIWIEAIRVSPKFQGCGVATALMRELCKRSKLTGAKEILSCTTSDNAPMRNVFGKPGVEMHPSSSLQFTDFQKMLSLSGWSATDVENQPENLLKAFAVENLVDDQLRLDNWENIESEEELKYLLNNMRDYGGSGHLPGLGKLLWSTDELKDSIRKGLVRKLCKSGSHPPAVMALVEDINLMKSFRSKYVCSIVATTANDFDSAIWEACRDENVPLIGGNRSFFVVIDMCNSTSPKSVLFQSLPIRKGLEIVMHRWAV